MDRLSSPSRPAAEADERAQVAAPSEETTEADVRRLIRRASRGSKDLTPPRREADDGVVLDVEVDGFRCLLIRIARHPWVHPTLSPREQEIARMVAKGYPNKTIAHVLDISTWTVGTHLRRIFAKLGVGSRAAMVARLLDDAPRWNKGG